MRQLIWCLRLSVDGPLEYAKRGFDRRLSELKEFLAIPTISTLFEHSDDMKRGAAWLEQHLTKIGLRNVKIVSSTAGHPLVYGDWVNLEGVPTVLLYGHYDVQPVDPLSEWVSPPFEPVIRGDYIFARGSTDMKTNAIALLAAVEAYLHTESLPVNVKILFEGEEEGGLPTSVSWALGDYVKSHHEELKADIGLSADGTIAGKSTPSLAYGSRGHLIVELSVRGPEVDLHSGEFGGTVHNPAQVLCDLIEGMHDKDGRVTLPHFYDDVQPLSQEERTELSRDFYTDEEWKRLTRVKQLYGEKGFSTAERVGARPTLEVLGIHSGYANEGFKAIVPAKALAKISMRLVPLQDWRRIKDDFIEYVRSHAPPTVTWGFNVIGGGPFGRIDRNSIGMRAASAALQETFGVKPLLRLEGGTMPVTGIVKQELGIDIVSMGFTLPDDGMHAPNEKFYLPNFGRAIETYIRFFDKLKPS